MTSLNLSTDIPNAINQLEELAAWVGTALSTINPTRSYLITDSQTVFAASDAIFKAPDGTRYLNIVLYIPLDPIYASDSSKKLWERALPIGDTTLPSGFKAN